MDWRIVSKAVAGGLAAALGGTGTAAVVVPPGVEMPWYAYVLIAFANAAVGFAAVYWAPKNTSTS